MWHSRRMWSKHCLNLLLRSIWDNFHFCRIWMTLQTIFCRHTSGYILICPERCLRSSRCWKSHPPAGPRFRFLWLTLMSLRWRAIRFLHRYRWRYEGREDCTRKYRTRVPKFPLHSNSKILWKHLIFWWCWGWWQRKHATCQVSTFTSSSEYTMLGSWSHPRRISLHHSCSREKFIAFDRWTLSRYTLTRCQSYLHFVMFWTR